MCHLQKGFFIRVAAPAAKVTPPFLSMLSLGKSFKRFYGKIPLNPWLPRCIVLKSTREVRGVLQGQEDFMVGSGEVKGSRTPTYIRGICYDVNNICKGKEQSASRSQVLADLTSFP